MPDDFFDELLCQIKTQAELKVTLAVMRKTLGWGKDGDHISLTQLEAITGLSHKSVVTGVKRAVARGTLKALKNTGGTTYYHLVFREDNMKKTSATSIKNIPLTSVKNTPTKDNKNTKTNPSPNGDAFANSRALFAALAHVCGYDLGKITDKMRGKLNQTTKVLRRDGVTPERLDAFGKWWATVDWRGKKGNLPEPAQVQNEWGRFVMWHKSCEQTEVEWL